MGSPSDAFGLLKMGNSVTPKRQKGKRYLPIQCGRLARGMGRAGWRGKPGGRTAGAGQGVTFTMQSRPQRIRLRPPPSRSVHAGKMRLFRCCRRCLFLSYPVCGGKHKYCKKARCPGAWKDGGVQHDTFRCIAIVRSARKGSKTLLGEKDDRKTVQGIHRCRMSYGSGGVRYAGYFMGMGIGRAALQHIHAGL